MSSLARALTEYLGDSSDRPFCWDTHNCWHFAAGWIARATGRDVAEALQSTGGQRGWIRRVQAAGGPQALVTGALGCAPIAPAFAQVGDIVLLPGTATGGALGLCAGSTVVCLAEGGGTVHQPMGEAVSAWRLAEVCAS